MDATVFLSVMAHGTARLSLLTALREYLDCVRSIVRSMSEKRGMVMVKGSICMFIVHVGLYK